MACSNALNELSEPSTGTNIFESMIISYLQYIIKFFVTVMTNLLMGAKNCNL
jgi:hypothetical protein